MARIAYIVAVTVLSHASASAVLARPYFINRPFHTGVDHDQALVVDGDTGFMTGGVAAADYDNDGWTDLYFTRLDQSDLLYRNRGDGTFENVTEGAFGLYHLDSARTNGASFADIDNDGDQDLYVTAVDSNRYYLYMNQGNGTFIEEATLRGASLETADTKQGMSIAFGDYDGDGYLDLFTTDWGSYQPDGRAHARLLRNLGGTQAGYFEDVTAAARIETFATDKVFGFSPRFSDINRDGLADLTIAADFVTSRLYFNNGDGTFSDVTESSNVGTDRNGMGSAIGDYNNDGELDWFVTAIYAPGGGDGGDGNRLYTNLNQGNFIDTTDTAGVRDGAWGWGAAWLDYDNDGDLDLTMTGSFDQLWENDGDGTFTNVRNDVGLGFGVNGTGLATLDFDRDGDMDIVVVENGGTPRLYQNIGGDHQDYLRIRTIGTSSNRDGIGARITVQPDADNEFAFMTREVDGGSNYLSLSERIAHFGLGDLEGLVDRVTIEWPSGIVQTFENVSPNTLMTIVEAEIPLLLGDMNGDGALDAFDVSEFELALADPQAYENLYPALPRNVLGDVNSDGLLDAFDVAAFEQFLAGDSTITPLPEPGALTLLGVCSLVATARRSPKARRDRRGAVVSSAQ